MDKAEKSKVSFPSTASIVTPLGSDWIFTMSFLGVNLRFSILDKVSVSEPTFTVPLKPINSGSELLVMVIVIGAVSEL